MLDRIASTATDDQKKALVAWADTLLIIKESSDSTAQKISKSFTATLDAKTIKPLVALIGKELTPLELASLSTGLSAIYKSDLSRLAKLKEGVALTGNALKDLGWNNRGWGGRFSIATAIATIVLFGGQSAGIAALGTAIGVPLWVVFGAGAAFLGQLVQRFAVQRRVETGYAVVEAKNRSDDT